jgi:hypothetical protein
MFAALPGSLVAAPFSLILLGALTTQIGTLQIAPVAIAVLSGYLAVSGSGLLVSLANRARKPAAAGAKPATESAPPRLTSTTHMGRTGRGRLSPASDDARDIEVSLYGWWPIELR